MESFLEQKFFQFLLLHPDEIETGGWFAPEKVTSWIAERPQEFASAFVLIWDLFLARRRKGAK